MLAAQRDALVDLSLANVFDAAAEPIRQSYRLEFRLPKKQVLDSVDRFFRTVLAVDALDLAGIDRFLSTPQSRGVARDYAEALAAFVRGVLVKDRPLKLSVTLPYAEYRALYIQALDGLAPFQRPLPNLVRAVVRFALNDFTALAPTGFTPLDEAMRTLARLAGTTEAPVEVGQNVGSSASIAICPLDDGVSRVLDLWARLRSRPAWTPNLEEECRLTANAKTLDVLDRQKVLALWAEAALRTDAKAAAEPLQLLAATYPFGQWASAERERSEHE
jgi:hypothetical protein